MRIATTIAKIRNGKWESLATPDTPIQEQKDAFKALIKSGGDAGKYEAAIVLTSSGSVKRAKFKAVKAEPKKKAAKK
jgi:hypothetical protein